MFQETGWSFDAKISITDLLTATGILASLYFGIYAARLSSSLARKSNVHILLQRWTSDSMDKHRAVAMKALQREAQKSNNGPIYTSAIWPDADLINPGDYQSISAVSHFFDDLNSLWNAGALDGKLTMAIFRRSLEAWIPYLSLLTNKTAGTNEAARVEHWRTTILVSLEKRIGKIPDLPVRQVSKEAESRPQV